MKKPNSVKIIALVFTSIVCISASSWLLWDEKVSEEKERNGLISIVIEEFLPYLLMLIGVLVGIVLLYQVIKRIT